MKTEKELMEWVLEASGPCIARADVERLLKGMKLVPADAVVLPPEGWLAPHDKGPWSAGKEGVFVFVQSEDFTHDVRLTISGDFADTEAKRRYADALAAQLNASLPPAPEQDNG